MLNVGGTLCGGRYVVRGPLGAGGMATVHGVFDTRLQVERAVKVLSPRFSAVASVRARFETEARTMARLQHPNVVAVHDVVEEDGLQCIVMELLAGGSMADRLEREGALPPHVALAVVRDVVAAVCAAHVAGVVHRDLKPENVLVGARGEIKVGDFGIAHLEVEDAERLTRTGMAIGTVGFMAPEQRNGVPDLDGRADVFSVGALLYTLLTGNRPADLFVAELDPDMLRSLPEPLSAVVAKATRYHRDDRYPSAPMLAEALALAAEALGAPVVVPRGGVLPADGASRTIMPEVAPTRPDVLVAELLPAAVAVPVAAAPAAEAPMGGLLPDAMLALAAELAAPDQPRPRRPREAPRPEATAADEPAPRIARPAPRALGPRPPSPVPEPPAPRTPAAPVVQKRATIAPIGGPRAPRREAPAPWWQRGKGGAGAGLRVRPANLALFGLVLASTGLAAGIWRMAGGDAPEDAEPALVSAVGPVAGAPSGGAGFGGAVRTGAGDADAVPDRKEDLPCTAGDTWAGDAGGRPFRLKLRTVEAGHVEADAEFRVGGAWRSLELAGSCDGGALTLGEPYAGGLRLAFDRVDDGMTGVVTQASGAATIVLDREW